jgi:hypothetical protein
MKKTKKVTTAEDWYPTADDGTVTVSIHKDRKKGAYAWRVAVWGDDDYGLERPNISITEAYDLFRCIGDGTTKQHLKDQGFIPA